MPTIKYSDLTLGAEIGEGANAHIYDIEAIRDQSYSGRMVFKKYKSSPKKLELDNLIELIRFRDALSNQDRLLLDSAILWPINLVEDKSKIIGTVMERLPDEAMETVGGKTQAIEIVTLMGREKYCAAADDKGRLKYAAGLLYCVAVLHKVGVVYGDLSPANAVLLPASSRVLLIDSDVCKVPGSPDDFRQAHTVSLTPPEQRGEPDSRSTQAGDVFKVAEMSARIMLNRPQLADADEVYDSLALRFGPIVANGLGFGMEADPSARPSSGQIYASFYSTLASLMRPPELSSVSVSPYGVIEGQAVTVSWEGMGIVEVEVVGPCGEKISVPTGETSVIVPARATGTFEVIARNNEGEVVGMSPRVICVTRPTVHSIEVPELFGVTTAITGMGADAAQHLGSAIDERVVSSRLTMPSYENSVQKLGTRTEIEALPSMEGIFDNEIKFDFGVHISLDRLNSAGVNSSLSSLLAATDKVSAQIRRIFAS